MKQALFILALIAVCQSAFCQIEKEPIEKASDYWVYVRLEDRSGVTTSDDAGRSKAGDVVAVLPVTNQFIPSETEKKEWMIYKTSLTETQRQSLLEPWEEQTTTKDNEIVITTKAYRKNKLDTSKLGVTVKKGLVADKIDATKIDYQVKTSEDLAKYEMKRKFYAYVQRPAIRLANVITRKAFAETVSTINKSGEDYNTLTLWEDAVDGDLVTATSQPTAECYDDDGVLTDYVSVIGATTNANYYRKITVPDAEWHNGSPSSGFTLQGTTANNQAIWIGENYFVLEKVRIINGEHSSDTNTAGIHNTADYALIQRNLIIVYDYSSSTTLFDAGIRFSGGTQNDSKCINNIIIINSSSGYEIAIYLVGTSTTAMPYNDLIYSNTIYSRDGNGYGIKHSHSSTVDINTFKNNICIGADVCYDMNASQIDDYNASSDTTADEANDLAEITTDIFVSVTSGSENLHLASGAAVIDEGVDLSGTFTIDIDGVTRSGTWDMGADEYVSSGAPPQIL